MNICNELVRTIQQQLTCAGIPSTKAAEAASNAVSGVCRDLGGRSVYLPRRVSWFDKRARDNAIRQMYNGRNMAEVCKRFQVSKQTVYRAQK